MRARVVGWTLAGLGSAAVAVAVLLPAGSPAHATQLPPADEYVTVSEGVDVAFLDPVTLEQRTGEDVSVSVRVRGDAKARDADEDTVVRLYDTTTSAADGTLISPTTTTRACLDRRTAEAVDCSGEAVDGRRTDVRGLTVAFPPTTPEQDRMMWDGTVQASFPVRFVGDERFRGLVVQRYEQEIPEQVLRPVAVAGVLLGSGEERLPADIWYSTTRTLLVEPVSGVVVSTEEIPLTILRAPDGTPGPVLLGGAFRPSEESVAGAVARARAVLDGSESSGGAVPWVAGSAGAVLVGLGGLFVARGRALPVQRATDAADRPRVPVA